MLRKKGVCENWRWECDLIFYFFTLPVKFYVYPVKIRIICIEISFKKCEVCTPYGVACGGGGLILRENLYYFRIYFSYFPFTFYLQFVSALKALRILSFTVSDKDECIEINFILLVFFKKISMKIRLKVIRTKR